MFGNRIGWGISAVLVAVVAVLLYMFASMGDISRPTATFGRRASEWKCTLGVSPTPFLPSMTVDGDAGQLYQQALKLYFEKQHQFDGFAGTGNPGTPEFKEVEPALKLLREAATHKKATIFGNDPKLVVNYERGGASLDAIKRLAGIMSRIGTLMGPKNEQEAAAYGEAVLAIGSHLFDERLSFGELEAGVSLMGEGAGLLMYLANNSKDAERAARIKEFNDSRMQFYNKVMMPMAKNVLRVFTPAPSAIGDMFAFAKARDAEMCWRTDAILALGRAKYGAKRWGDQKGAVQLLAAYADDPSQPPAIRAAATAARELTIEQYRMLN